MANVLITGASAGIGKEFARIYARRKHNLILVARREDALRQLSEQLRTEYGVTAHVIPVDLADPDGASAVKQAVDTAGIEVSLLVNNAGFGINGAFARVDEQSHLDIIQVNITSLVRLTRMFLPGMLNRGAGGIMNVASTAAFVPGPMMAVYYATKAFVLSFTEALANEVAGSGVKVSCLCPGATLTEFQIRSGMDKTNLFKSGSVMSAQTVAEMGVNGLERNQTVVICGATNQFAVTTSRFVPRKVTTAIVRRLQDLERQ